MHISANLTGRYIFIIDYILTELNKDRTLLLFISKNLAWGVFKGAFEEKNA